VCEGGGRARMGVVTGESTRAAVVNGVLDVGIERTRLLVC
jgi:hypothetical protein